MLALFKFIYRILLDLFIPLIKQHQPFLAFLNPSKYDRRLVELCHLHLTQPNEALLDQSTSDSRAHAQLSD